jgi:cell wall assembly regulator SMI1
MSLTTLDEALALLASDPERASLAGEQSRWLVEDAEVPLGYRFPPSYREFLVRCGGGTVAGHRVLGLREGDLEAPGPGSVLDAVARARGEDGLPWEYLPVERLAGGGYLVLDMSRVDAEGEAPVMEWGADRDSMECVVVAGSFGEYLLRLARGAESARVSP